MGSAAAWTLVGLTGWSGLGAIFRMRWGYELAAHALAEYQFSAQSVYGSLFGGPDRA